MMARAASLNLFSGNCSCSRRWAQVAAILQMNETQAREIRRRRRDFIRPHHPDRGGDPDLFIAGLGAFDTGLDRSYARPAHQEVVVRRS